MLGRGVQMSLWGQHSCDLVGQELQDQQMEALAQWAAAYWPMLQYLDLSGNMLGPAGG